MESGIGSVGPLGHAPIPYHVEPSGAGSGQPPPGPSRAGYRPTRLGQAALGLRGCITCVLLR